MKDRGMIKWMPFDSVISSKQMVQSILKKKEYVTKPCLSEEQMEEMERRLQEAFHSQMVVHVSYYYRGKILCKNDLILSIRKNEKGILFQDHTLLYFDQILNVSI